MKLYFLIIVGLILNVYSNCSFASVENERVCLARNIYYEAGAESYAGKLAVAQVTVNRAESGKYPSTICGVVSQSTIKSNKRICQFSWNCEPAKGIKLESKAWQASLNIADKILKDEVRHSLIHKTKALHFHSVNVNPKWANEDKKVIQIGNHIFYRG